MGFTPRKAEQPLSAGQIYVRGMFMEHSHDIFPEYLEKVHKEILGNIPKNVPRILNIEYTLNVP